MQTSALGRPALKTPMRRAVECLVSIKFKDRGQHLAGERAVAQAIEEAMRDARTDERVTVVNALAETVPSSAGVGIATPNKEKELE